MELGAIEAAVGVGIGVLVDVSVEVDVAGVHETVLAFCLTNSHSEVPNV
jgi:hypothetical protein